MDKLKTPENMYWHVRQHLLTQGKKAHDNNSITLLLASDGCRCAAGCLIPSAWENERSIADIERGCVTFRVPDDVRMHEEVRSFLNGHYNIEEYEIDGEEADSWEIGVHVAERGCLTLNTQMLFHHGVALTRKNIQILCDLEIVHEGHDVKDWEKELDKIAIKYDLCDYMISPRDTVTLPEKNATLEELVK